MRCVVCVNVHKSVNQMLGLINALLSILMLCFIFKKIFKMCYVSFQSYVTITTSMLAVDPASVGVDVCLFT